MTQPLDEATIDAIVDAAIEQGLADLPTAFADRLGSVAIVVEDEPTRRAAGEHRRRRPVRPLPGRARARPSPPTGSPIPSKITLFRGPLVRANRDPAALYAAVVETLQHEIAHHFGISDARLRELHHGRSRRRR